MDKIFNLSGSLLQGRVGKIEKSIHPFPELLAHTVGAQGAVAYPSVLGNWQMKLTDSYSKILLAIINTNVLQPGSSIT